MLPIFNNHYDDCQNNLTTLLKVVSKFVARCRKLKICDF